MFETIVALATAPLKSALAIIRLSGDDCFLITSKVFTKDLTKVKERKIHHGFIVDGDRKIDEVVLLTYPGPNSFTGEDSVEIITHGSMLIVSEIVNLLISKGARQAVNGEFSSRAFLNGKVDLIQAEAINDLINATTKEAKDLSLFALDGKTSALFRPIKDKIGEILASIEVNIDYPEYEDIEEVSRSLVVKTCNEIIDSLKDLISLGEKNKLYKDGVDIVLVGKPNVGKSSLLNALLKEDKAIVTDIAGTTRDIVEGEINIFGVPARLYDTAGYHEAKDVIERIGINKTKDVLSKADLVVYLEDETGIDEELYSLVKEQKHIIVRNKSDLVIDKDENTVYISALTGDIEPLLMKIKEVLDLDELSVAPTFNNERQLGLLKKMVDALKLAIKDVDSGEPIDLVAVSIMSAYNLALDLLGEGNKNDLSDEIFSRFCVGK